MLFLRLDLIHRGINDFPDDDKPSFHIVSALIKHLALLLLLLGIYRSYIISCLIT